MILIGTLLIEVSTRIRNNIIGLIIEHFKHENCYQICNFRMLSQVKFVLLPECDLKKFMLVIKKITFSFSTSFWWTFTNPFSPIMSCGFLNFTLNMLDILLFSSIYISYSVDFFITSIDFFISDGVK